MKKKALIMGASGRAGRHISNILAERGWQITNFRRGQDELIKVAEDADVIVYALNPPYHLWEQQALGLLDNALRAAEMTGAALFFPGNVYVFGEEPSPWGDDTPRSACNSLGQVRIDMENALRRSNAQTIVLRAGDFIDTAPSGNWFDAIMLAKINKNTFIYPGPLDCPHSWAFLPDFANGAVDLIEDRKSLPLHSEFQFSGYNLTGEEQGHAIEQTLDRPIEIKTMNWAPLYLAAPFWLMARNLIKMRYLWSTPHRLISSRDFAVTPLDEALLPALKPHLVQS